MGKLSIVWILLLVITLTSCSSKTDKNLSLKKKNVVTGRVVSIIDGDTYDALLEGNKILRIRMEGIDAPEKGMPFYQKSKKYLSSLCYNREVTILFTGVDNHKRFLAYTYNEQGKGLSQEMIKEGLAWHYKRYNADSSLSILETEARNLKKGLWSEEVIMSPWRYRSLHREGFSTKDSFKIEGDKR